MSPPSRRPASRGRPGPSTPTGAAGAAGPSAAGRAAPAAPADPLAVAALIDELPDHVDAMPAPMIDGYLCGVLLQRRPVALDRWWPPVLGAARRHALPAGAVVDRLLALVRQRHAELDRAIAARAWFDPWVFDPPDGVAPGEAVFPWVAGFAHAMAVFEDLGAVPNPAMDEPLALLYQHLDPQDLEDADELLDVIDAMEPPADLAEAVEQLVRATLLIADETRPRRVGASR